MEDPQQSGGEPIDEVQTYPPRGVILRTVCSIGAQKYQHVADGMGGHVSEYLGIGTDCANAVTRDHLAGHLGYYARLTANTNMLKKVEAQEISKQLKAAIELVRGATYVLDTGAGCYVMLVNGPRKMTFWETVKWRLFGAVPYAKTQNELIAAAYYQAGVVDIVEGELAD